MGNLAGLYYQSYRSLYYDEKDEYYDMISSLTEATESHPHTHAFNNLGVAYLEMGEKKNAHFYFSQAIQLDATNVIAYINRAELNQKEKRFHIALQDLNKALEVSPENISAVRSRAYFYKETGDLRLALVDFKTALALEPEFPQTKIEIDQLERKIKLS